MHHALKSLLPSLPRWSQSLLGERCHRRVAQAATSLAAPHAADATHGDVPAVAEAPPRGCGWFDSSHELHQGLCVTEHSQPDTVANELGVTAWLDLHLAGWTSPSGVALRH